MSEILCSTGALLGRPNGRNYRLMEGFAKQLSCDGYEFMMYSTWHDQIEELISFLKSIKLYTPVMHCEKGVGEKISLGEDKQLLTEAIQLFELNCSIAQRIGAKKLVVHLWGGIPSDQHFNVNLHAYENLSEIAEKYNVDLLVENVVCNQKDPMTHWTELVKAFPNIHFVFDTKMAEFHNQLDLLYSSDYSWLWQDDHIKHYHVNDYGGGYMDWQNLRTLPIGKGHVDFKRFFDFINTHTSVDTFTVESTAFNKEGIVDTDMLNTQFDYLRSTIK